MRARGRNPEHSSADAFKVDATESSVVNQPASTGGSGINQLTGDVTAGPGTGSQAATIANNAVTNAKAAQMAAHTFKGNPTGSTANATDMSDTQATAELNVVVGDSGSGGTKGLVPAPGAGDAAAGKFLKADGTFAVPPGTTSGLSRVIWCTIDGLGNVIGTGYKGCVRVPFACTIVAATVLSVDVNSTSGSIAIDILKSNSATYPPTASITSSTPPTLSSQNHSRDTTLASWTTSIAAGDHVGFKVLTSPTPASVIRIEVELEVTM